ncbi:glycosyltransferase family 1 protein [Sphingobacterium thalpophilum]|uniref:D-inositol-3-phosphate glycosyltransferase n=1 Tax=Sphingobacterium thalpophilum TaxID=259 RepID=A0A4U9VB66_9SPHI|nr:glycosyltransferase family 1 protein [Sphingobacterium thalpophilum]VTR40071.1 D-inositol-3-phosphate glycosyltransferase [Sphingobacterium thalpophilum]
MKNLNIIFDAERMKYPHTGLFHFCKQLGQALLKKTTDPYEMVFFTNNPANEDFGTEANYYQQKSLQKFWMPRFANFNLWHSSFQLSDYFPRNSRIKVLSTIHDLNFLKEGKSIEKEKKYLKKIQANLDRADIVVAISHYVKKDLENYCDLKRKPLHVIYNGNNIDQKYLDQLDRPQDNTHKPFIYSIGTINRKKNFHTLLYLLVGNNLELTISGIIAEPDYNQYILDLAAELGVAERVHLTGPVSEEEKYRYLRDCALFVFPSIAEGFGLPVIEAMSFGKKVLLSKYTCLPEIGGPEAFFLDSTDPDYMIEFGKTTLQDIINGEDRANEIKSWAEQFSWDKAASEYWKLYKELLK